MNLGRPLFLSLMSMVFVSFSGPAIASESDETQAEKAALSWLSLVDDGKYPESWDEAALLFKSRVSKPDWQVQVKAAREPMGKLIGRKVKTRTYAKSLPGAPDGEYVVIQFETEFEGKAAALETITPQRDKDGEWRVSGYFIR